MTPTENPKGVTGIQDKYNSQLLCNRGDTLVFQHATADNALKVTPHSASVPMRTEDL